MGILGRINRVIRSNVNELVDRMSDPAKEIDLLIVEMEEGLKKAREEVVSTTAMAKRTELECKRLEEEVERWQRRAEQAVRAGDDQLAREALGQKMTVDQELGAAGRAHQEQLAHIAELKGSLKALEIKLKDVKLRKESLKQRARAAKEGKKGLAGGKAFEEFDRLESRIEAMEEIGEIDASMEAREAATAAKFARLEREAGHPEMEDELAELKRRMAEEE